MNTQDSFRKSDPPSNFGSRGKTGKAKRVSQKKRGNRIENSLPHRIHPISPKYLVPHLRHCLPSFLLSSHEPWRVHNPSGWRRITWNTYAHKTTELCSLKCKPLPIDTKARCHSIGYCWSPSTLTPIFNPTYGVPPITATPEDGPLSHSSTARGYNIYII